MVITTNYPKQMGTGNKQRCLYSDVRQKRLLIKLIRRFFKGYLILLKEQLTHKALQS